MHPPKLHKVKGHSNDKFNDIADEEANSARNLDIEDIYIKPDTISPFVTSYIHVDPETEDINQTHNRIEMYPGHYLKTTDQTNRNNSNNLYLQQKMEKHFNTTKTINITSTSKLNSTTMDKANPLDASFTYEHGFRLKTLTFRLPTLKNTKLWKLSTSNTCPRCITQDNNIIEDQNHLWTCQHTINSLPHLFVLTKENIIRRIPNIKTLNKEENALSITIDDLIDFIKPDSNNPLSFLASPIAQGFITTETESILQNKFQAPQKAKKDWILLLLDSWLSAFYKYIWIESRNTLVDFQQNRKTFSQQGRKNIPINIPPDVRPPPEPPPNTQSLPHNTRRSTRIRNNQQNSNPDNIGGAASSSR